jgi:hypothetical protein
MRKRSNENDSLLSRRDFARTAALAAASAAIAPIRLPAAPIEPGRRSDDPTQTPPQTSLSPADQAEVDARVAEILRKRGDRLSPDQKTEIRRLTTELQKSIVRLRAYPLGNSSQPATVLKIVSSKTPTPTKTRG